MERKWISPGQFETLTRLTYAAAVDPHQWQVFLDELGKVSGEIRTHLIGYDLEWNSALANVVYGYDPDALATYDAHYQTKNVWAPGFAAGEVGSVMSADAMAPFETLRRSEFYNDWILPQEDISAGGGAVLLRDATRLFMIGGNIRRRDADRLEKPFLGLVGRLVPVLRHALDINRALSGLKLEAHLLRIGHDPADAAVVLVSPDRRIAFCNDLAAAMIGKGDVIRTDARGAVRLVLPALDAQFEQVVKGPPGSPARRIEVPTGEGLRHEGHAVPMEDRVLALLPLAARPFAALPLTALILRRRMTGTGVSGLLRRRYAMTEAEAALALALSEGRSLGQIAEARGVSIHTVRAQAKAVLAKTGTHRQADLVRLLAGLPRR